MAVVCIICNGSGSYLAPRRDIKSWGTLYRAVVIRDHKAIFELSVGESDFPRRPVQYDRAFRSYNDNDNNTYIYIYPGSPLALAVFGGAFQIINDKMTKKSPTLKIN